MSDLNKLANNLHKYLTESDGRKPKPYDTKAEVLRIEGDTAWVKIPGGVDETPVQRTNNANPGDTVVVRVSGGRAWIAGNNTSPATDDARANAAFDVGTAAGIAANAAIGEANRAREAAGYAAGEAGRAKTAADHAEEVAEGVEAIAESAKTAADTAFTNLSQVQSVLEVAQWIATHGTYTKATTYVEGTTYYTLTGVVEPSPYAERKYYVLSEGIYIQTNVEATAVAEPVVADIDTYYELLEDRYTLTEDTEIDPNKTYYTISDTYYVTTGTPVSIPKPEDISLYYTLNVRNAIGDYVQTHLAVTNDGLYVMTDKLQWKVLIASDGVYIINPEGENVAKYKDTITIGKDDGTEGAQFIDYRSVRVYDDVNMALIATGHEDEATPYFWVSNLKDKQSNFEMIITRICTQSSISEMIIPGYYWSVGWPDELVSLVSLPGVQAAVGSFNTAIVEIDGVEYTKDSYLYLPQNISQRTYDFTLSKPAPEGAQIVVKCVKDTQDRNNKWVLVEDQIFYSDGITTQFNFETERLYPYDYIQIINNTDIIKVPPLQFNKGTNNKLSSISTGLWYSPNTEITIKYTVTSSVQVPAFTLGKRTSGKGVGPYSCVVGQDCAASAPHSFSGGKDTITTGQRSFAYGSGCKAIGQDCIAVGTTVMAGYSSAAFGRDTIAENSGFAAGILTTSSGYNAFTEGGFTKAIGDCSHTAGFGTVAEDGNFVIGTYNIPDSSSPNSWDGSWRDIDTPEEYPSSLIIGTQHAFVIGNGLSEESRSNAFTVDWDGCAASWSSDFERDVGGSTNGGFALLDKNGNTIAYMKALSTLDSQSRTIEGFNVGTSRDVNGSTKWNTLKMQIDANGDPVVTINQPKAWRDAIGLNSVIDAGYVSVGQISANAYKDVTITYSFANTPRVVATLFTSGTAANIGNVTVAVHSVTATSAKVRIFNNRSSTLSPGIEWIAVDI